MPIKKTPFKKSAGEKPALKSYRLFKAHVKMVKQISKKLTTKEVKVSESDVVRDAIKEKFAFHFNR